MKLLFIFMVLSSVTFYSYSQTDDITYELEGDDTPEGHYAGLDIGMGTLMLDNEAFYDYWNTSKLNVFAFNFNLFDYKLPIVKHYLGLTTGLGAGINSVSLKQYDILHVASEPGGKTDTIFGQINNTQTYRSNSLSYFTLNVPLMIEVCSKATSKKSFYLDIGAVGYWNMGGSWSSRGKYNNGDRFNNTVNSRFQMAPFGAYATVRTGFEYYGLFVNYNLTPLFKKSATALVYPLTFGITLNFDY